MKSRIEYYIENSISLVASESLLHPQIKDALASSSHQLTVEGTVNKRFFPVPHELNDLERETKKKFCNIFKLNFCDIRPTTATHANIAIFIYILNQGDTILSLNINDGGHVSHGHQDSFAKRFYKIINYNLEANGSVNLSKLKHLILKHNPKLVISGGSSCPREINHSTIAKISHQNNAYHLADISHSAGLIAANIIPNTLSESDFVTFGTQKTFLGPRGGVILSKIKFSKGIEKAIFPGTEGAMLIPQILAKKVAVDFINTVDFKIIQRRIVKFSKLLVQLFVADNINVITCGTDNHIVLIKVENAKIIIENLHRIGLRCNLNPIPNTKKWGIRFGTTSIAQSALSELEVLELFKKTSNYVSSQSEKTLILLKEYIKYIVRNRKHLLQEIQKGNFSNQNIISNRESLTKSSLISGAVSNFSEFAPLVKFKQSESDFFELNKVGVIIPTISNDENLEEVINYAINKGNNVTVLVIDASYTSDKLITRYKDNIYIVSLQYFIDSIIDKQKLISEFNFNTESNQGKGLSLMLGFIILWQNNINHAFFMDADLEGVKEYDPLEKLAFPQKQNESVHHSLIATPNRRNEVIHGVLNALEYQNPKLIGKVKKYIHFLAGERYLRVDKYLEMPWLTNYGIETWINFYSASRDFCTYQISNNRRDDAINSYVKNESMLMYCSKLVSQILNSNILQEYSINSIRKFNSSINSSNLISILPNKIDEVVQSYSIKTDCMLPSAIDFFTKDYLCDEYNLFILNSEFAYD
ncbi:MAG: hypothetical protein KAH72_03775 [Flavobacteriaceae bacterium]|nr:hypothetical protein [Flavobacteriaceae bacterium]